MAAVSIGWAGNQRETDSGLCAVIVSERAVFCALDGLCGDNIVEIGADTGNEPGTVHRIGYRKQGFRHGRVSAIGGRAFGFGCGWRFGMKAVARKAGGM